MILFRCDANPHLGFGHLTRCIKLAETLVNRGHEVALFGILEEHLNDADRRLFTHHCPAPAWQDGPSDAKALLAYGHSLKAKAYILDDFRVDEPYQLVLRKAGVSWLQFEPWGDQPLWADLVYSAHIAADEIAFKAASNNPDADFLIGPRYALLDKQFQNQPVRQASDNIQTVLLTFGGGSDRGAFQRVIKTVFNPMHDTRFILTSGSNNPHNPALAAWVSQYPDRLELHIQTDQMAALMARSDLAIMAAGTTSLESAAMGLPMILIAIADNQVKPAKAWATSGGAIYVGPLEQLEDQALKQAYARMRDRTTRQSMIQSLYRIGIDGYGASRVADAIENRLLNA